MNNLEPGVEMFAPETILKTDAEGEDSPTGKKELSAKEEDELISMETLRESPVQWPERFPGMDDFMNMSNTPIHQPSGDYSPGVSNMDTAQINQLASLTPDQLIEKIKSMQDEVYQLGLRESKEMTRGKLLGIFDRMAKSKK
ncbi:hypothetical protein KR215_011967 [Drosophila sulfurigaster]|nr:hypothetical protein KR215_011967 [Drosophila sulfurigaster]